MTKPVVLCILDGFGVAPSGSGNAVSRAKMPFYNGLAAKYPNMLLGASGAEVGLPPRTMGNSEVGHITMGAGRVVNQFLRRFQLEDLSKNKHLAAFLRKTKGAVHFVGLSSDGRVHADAGDAIKVAKIAARSGHEIIWHFISDGRDVDPRSAEKYVKMIRAGVPGARFGSLEGRYYAMDRNGNWDRTDAAFAAISGRAEPVRIDIASAISASYRAGKTDEFIKPVRFAGTPAIGPRDGVLFFNYRADRARQFLKRLVESKITKNILCFSQYGDGLDKDCPALLPDAQVKNTLGDVLAGNGITQLRLAETEKYNHVTYFFDAERMIDYPGEEKILEASPNVATFDIAPEMAARGITSQFLKNIGRFDAVIMNYANGDMVGHTGNIGATVKALEFLDACLAKIVPAALKLGGAVLITSDHGNVEKMRAGFFGRRSWT
ncbi:MAG: 2,3-bisphosphoglycerate-independent phosphoglycerate mutase, partial [Rickettsiales bacterium]|nr:2,3-bisphosphoglycerate-independent phosphoglycerate mutase [Rickettsiales bacterium]